MAELIRTNDPALISAVEGLLGEAGIVYDVTDRNMSVMQGLLMDAIQPRVLVPDEQIEQARQLLVDAGLGEWIRPAR